MKMAGTTSEKCTFRRPPCSSIGSGDALDRVQRGLPGETLGGHRHQVRGQRREHERGIGVGDHAAQRLQVELGGEEQHSADHGRDDQHRAQREPPVRAQLAGQLGDGHELDALLLAGLQDPRQRLHRLRPVVAVAGAVSVVQEQDRPRIEPRHAAVDDSLDAGLGRVPDARRPPHHAVAEAARHRHQEGAAKAVRGPEQRRRSGAGRAHDRFVQRAQLVGDPGRPLEGEQPVVVAVAGQLVALGHDPAGDLGVGAHLAAQREEGGAHAGRGQRVQDRRGELGAGPVVEGDRRLRAPAPDHRR